MNLEQVVCSFHDLDENLTIYVKAPWSFSSDAIVEVEPVDGLVPPHAKHLGFEYFLEVFIARDFLEGWIGSLGIRPTNRELTERLIRYAANDA
ncbi:hypothetical protein C9928_05210 [Pseudidiomarina aestuarii]|uniref:Uncharacterized protein n=1 Tax=Pseudidiomarina aestuarii TaxID=624146 RepID=A0A6N4DH64_9GAMM|nr:hypothetical protein C9928_05210 [Pseudidiomarina aestuarii]